MTGRRSNQLSYAPGRRLWSVALQRPPARAGRERANIPPERLATFIVGDPDGVAEQATELLETGLDALIFNMPYVHEPESIQLLGETLGPLCSDVPSGRSSVG